jgi:nucleotide-binding universal stress UspA family protein
MYRRILVAVDGSAPSTRAFHEGLRLAGDQGAELRVIHVVDFGVLLASYADASLLDIGHLEATLRSTGAAIVKATLADARGSRVAVDSALIETDTGDVARAILDEAARWGADLIVLGTHGRGGLAHLLLGSVAEGVVHGSSLPVLLLRGRPAARHPEAGPTEGQNAGQGGV